MQGDLLKEGDLKRLAKDFRNNKKNVKNSTFGVAVAFTNRGRAKLRRFLARLILLHKKSVSLARGSRDTLKK